MSEESPKTDIRHIHKQMKAVCTLIQPEYKNVFNKTMKLLELQLILKELTQKETPQFQASSISHGAQVSCDLASFVRAVAPACNETERTFLRNLQNIEQTLRMAAQLKQFQNDSKTVRPEDLMIQFMTPGQQKTFKEFDQFYSAQGETEQEVPHGSSESSFFTGSYESGKGD